MEQKQKITFKDRVSNIWYYYKWMIIIVGVLVLALIIATVQLIDQKDNDIDMLYIGAGVLSVSDNGKLKDFVADYINDVNGDGTKQVGLLELTATTDNVSRIDGESVTIDYDTNKSVLQRFETEVRAGDALIYLCDDYYYERLKSTGVLAPLSSVLESYEMPERTYDEYGVYLKDLGLSLAPGFSSLPDTTIVCLRRSPENDDIKYGRTFEEWTAHKLLFAKLMTYRRDDVVYNDTDIDIVYYGDVNIADEEKYLFKSLILELVGKKQGFGDINYSFVKAEPPIIIKGNESQEALTEAELHKDFCEMLEDGQSRIMIVDRKYFDLVIKYGEPVSLDDMGIEQKILTSDADYAAMLQYGVSITALEKKPSLICSLPDDALICITQGENSKDNADILSKLIAYCE